jgi:hypothetical protein
MPGEYRIVIKGHDGTQIGVLQLYESLTYRKVVNGVGEAVLVANYGANPATDLLLDQIVTDTILEVQRRASPLHPWIVDWIGFHRKPDTNITDVATKRKTWGFYDANHLLRRRIIKPPADGYAYGEGRKAGSDRWLATGILPNMLRDLVRWQCVYPEDPWRVVSGLYVQDNEVAVSGGGLPGLVYDAGLISNAVFCSKIWLNDLFAGLDIGAFNELIRTPDGDTWTVQAVDINMAGIYALETFDDGPGERMYAGCGLQVLTGWSEVWRSDIGSPTGWTNVLDPADRYAVMALCVHGGQIYAGFGGGAYYSGGMFYGQGDIYRSASGAAATWAQVFAPGSGMGLGGLYGYTQGLISWGGFIYAATSYVQPAFMLDLYSYWTARVLRSPTGNVGTWSVVLDVAGPKEPVTLPGGSTQLMHQSLDGFCCFAVFGAYLYAGMGDRFHPFAKRGRIYRTLDGLTWVQVFGDNLIDHPEYASPGVTSLTVHGGALWAGMGGDGQNDGAVWWSDDGVTWNKSFDGRGYEYNICHTLLSFNTNLYAGMGYAPLSGARGYYSGNPTDMGDIWRMTIDGWDAPDWLQDSGGRWPELLDILGESANGVDDCDFGITPVNYGGIIQEWLFSVKRPCWGTDRRSTSPSPTIFSINRGNMADPVYVIDRSNTATAVYVTQIGEGQNRESREFVDVVEMSLSPWNRIEAVGDLQGIDSPGEMYVQAQQLVEELGPKKAFSFVPLETPATRYGVEWNHGDLVTAYFDGLAFHCKIMEVVVTLDNNAGVEQIRPTFKLLEVI